MQSGGINREMCVGSLGFSADSSTNSLQQQQQNQTLTFGSPGSPHLQKEEHGCYFPIMFQGLSCSMQTVVTNII